MSLIIPDVSHFEAVDSFHDLIAGGFPAIITKAAQGLSYRDPTYQPYYDRAHEVGEVFGAYTFETAGGSPGGQAEFFLSTAHLKAGDLQPFVDCEQAGLTASDLEQELVQLEMDGYAPIPYFSYDYWANVLGRPTKRPAWVAAYRGTLPAMPGLEVMAWQFTDHFQFPGIPQACDASHFYGSLDDLKAYCIK